MEYPLKWTLSIVRDFCEIPLAGSDRYNSVELQSAERNGENGFVAILHHVEGGLDVLFEAPLGLDRNWAINEPSMAHLRVRKINPVVFRKTHCLVTATEVDVAAEFMDSFGDQISLRVKHIFRRPSLPLFAPAPPHKNSNPPCLRFMAMDVAHLLPSGSQVCLHVNKEPQDIAYFLLPASLAPYTSTRAGSSFLLAGLALNVDDDERYADLKFEQDGLLVAAQGLWLEVSGLPSVDELLKITSGDSSSGKFRVKSPIGVLATGRYKVESVGGKMKWSLESVRQDWFPGWRSPIRLLLRFARNRKRRHERVRWSSLSNSRDDGIWTHVGGWIVSEK